MSKLKDFYQEHNLNRRYFAFLIGVSTSSLRKYELGEHISDRMTAIIDRGIGIVKSGNLYFPNSASSEAYSKEWTSIFAM